jgi:hypothetical protein
MNTSVRTNLVNVLLVFFSLIFISLTPLAAEAGFSDIFGSSEEGSSLSAPLPAIALSGTLGASLMVGPDGADLLQSPVAALPFMKLTMQWKAGQTEAKSLLEISPRSMEAPITWEDLLREVSVRQYFSWGHLEAGLMIREWGKGEGVHVVDPLNSLDQRYGIVPDLNAMKIPTMMVSVNLQREASALELVYLPFFQPMKLALFGEWAVADPQFAALITETTAVENTRTLSHGQFAARGRATLGPADIGLVYYYGFQSQPGYEITMGPHPLNPLVYIPTGIEAILYTRSQLFGLEGALVLGPFTLLWEGGFWLSEDTEGTDATRYNSKLAYLGGVEYMLPGTSVFTSVQWSGHYILGFDGLQFPDVDALQAYDGKPYANMLVAAVEIPLLRERLNIRLAGMYQLESRGYALLPSIRWSLNDNLELELSSRIYGAAGTSAPDSIYQRWDGNDVLEIRMTHSF